MFTATCVLKPHTIKALIVATCYITSILTVVSLKLHLSPKCVHHKCAYIVCKQNLLAC